MYRFIILQILFITFLSSEEIGHSNDFTLRLVHFIIFIAILYFFVYKYIKAIFINRRENIENKFLKIEEQLNDSLNEKKLATKNLKKSQKSANEIINFTNENIKSSKDQLKKQKKIQIIKLEELYEQKKIHYAHSFKIELIKDAMQDLMNKNKFISDDYIVKTIVKKVNK